MIAVVCPGQGSQTPGLLAPWLEVPAVADRLGWLSTAVGPLAGADLLTHGTTSGADAIRDTAVAQPLIVAAGLGAASALWDGPAAAAGTLGATAGHSVGEVTAAVLAGVLSPEAGVVLVRERGAAMAAAAAVTPTAMSAVVGGAPEDVEAAIARSGAIAANHNGAGQVVAAGTVEQVEALAADPPARARVVPLSVAGAFHSAHMAPAAERLAAVAAGVPVADPVVALLSNADGAVVSAGAEVLARIVAQVARPVRWDACQATLARLGVTALLELPPAGALVGLARRALPGVELLALRTPDDLDAARDLLARHGAGPGARQDAPPHGDPAASAIPTPTGSPA